MIELMQGLTRRTRQHHAIEHATIHVLSARFPQQRFSGHSDPFGFTIYADVETSEMRRAVGDALLRLQAGESRLAIHPNCGTNLATTGVLVALIALLIGRMRRGVLERFSAALLLILPTLVFSRPLGFHLQAYTTLADVQDRWLIDIRATGAESLHAYRVLFE